MSQIEKDVDALIYKWGNSGSPVLRDEIVKYIGSRPVAVGVAHIEDHGPGVWVEPPQPVEPVAGQALTEDVICGVLYRTSTDESEDGKWIEERECRKVAKAIMSHATALQHPQPKAVSGAVPEPSAGLLSKWAHDLDYSDLDEEAEAFAKNFKTIPDAASRGFYVGWKLALLTSRQEGR